MDKRSNTYVAQIRGTLTFEIVVEDGRYRVNEGWFDCRSADDGRTFSAWDAATEELVTDEQILRSIFETMPGKGPI